MVGRKSKSKIKKPTALLPVELYTVSYSPVFPRGSKKEIRDDNGNLLFSNKQMRIKHSQIYTKEEIENVVENLVRFGYKNVEAEQLSIDLPSKCPSCKREGTPDIVTDRRAELKKPKYRLMYSHDSAPRSCYVGTVNLTSMPQIKLKKGLEINALGYGKRAGIYPVE